MPKFDNRLFLPGFKVLKSVCANPLIMHIAKVNKSSCIHCGSKRLRKKDTFIRQILHETTGLRRCILKIKTHKFQCYRCKRYFNERLPGILKYQRATEKLKEQIYHLHTKGVSSTDLARDNHISNSTVERYFQQIYQRKNKMISQRSWPKVLGIDEHFVHKNKFATTFCDLRKHRVFDLKLGRRTSELQSYIQQIPGANKVKVVCIDLSHTYKKMIQQCFPNALIVADRFHVVRLINHAFMKAYRSIKTDIRYHRQFIRLLITSPEKLSKNQIQNQQKLFKEQPAIYHLYLAHQLLLKIMKNKHLTARKAKPIVCEFLNFIKLLKSSRFQPLVKLGNTLYKWKDEVARMWRFTKNNGITEGFHRKMKLIQRRAYGFRNFENYRLRVKIACG